MAEPVPLQLWDLWIPDAGATGISFARGRLLTTDILLVHAPPPILTVEVRSDDGRRLAYGKDLAQTAALPMARLTCLGPHVVREDIWPGRTDVGRLVILPGGEIGTLLQWWNAGDGSEWRWQVEFYNRR